MSDEQQPVAWAAVWPDDFVDCNWIYSSREDAEWAALKGDNIDGRRGIGTVIPLYRKPQPTLTDAEREALEQCAKDYEDSAARCRERGLDGEAVKRMKRAMVLSGLLESTCGTNATETCRDAIMEINALRAETARLRVADLEAEINNLQYEIARLRLADAEREAVELAYSRLTADTNYASVAATLRGLLERLGGER